MPEKIDLQFPPSAEPPQLDSESLRAAAARAMRLPADQLAAVRTSRLSFDGRKRFRCWRLAIQVWRRGEDVPPPPATTPPTIAAPPANAPHAVIIGSGPAGLFCALDLLANGIAVTLLERGLDVQKRRRSIAELHRGRGADPDSNYCFGEGGAGTYSDGKLYTRSGKKKELRAVLESLVAHGAPLEILSSWRPHVGSNRLPEVVKAMRESILRAGGEVRFGCRAEEILTEGQGDAARVAGVLAHDLATQTKARMDADAVILATGHSALDSIEMARRAGARLEAKGFAMGLRIEHPQPWLDAHQYGGLRGSCELPAAFYELTTQSEGRGVYSFCMCPGGFIVPASTAADRVVVNGMSLSRRDSPFANSGLVVSIEPEDWCGSRGLEWGWQELLKRDGGSPELPDHPEQDPTFGAKLQAALERAAARAGGGSGRAPSQRADNLAEGGSSVAEALATSYTPGVTPSDLSQVLPSGMFSRLRQGLIDFDGRIPGFAGPEGQVLGVESRTSSPVRIMRERESMQALGLAGLYPCGEGAGFAGGIISAALDGRRVAAALSKAALRSG